MMNEEKATKILKEAIMDNGLYSLGQYVFWDYRDDTIRLDSLYTLEELEAIVWWMKNKSFEQSENKQ